MVKINAPSTNTIFGFGVKGVPSAINDTLIFNQSTQQFEWTFQASTVHAQISSNVTQQPIVTTPVKITMNQNDDVQGIIHSETILPEDVVMVSAGTYLVIAAPQTVRTSGAMPRFTDFWLRVNDVDVPDSNVRVSSDKNSDTDVIVTQNTLDLEINDKLNIMMSISATGEGIGIAPITPAGEPQIPSIILTVLKLTNSM